MTTLYSSKTSALEMGIFYARGKNDIPVESLELKKKTMRHPLSDDEKDNYEAETCEIENANGEKVLLSVSPCGDGYHLWICSLDGMCIRT